MKTRHIHLAILLALALGSPCLLGQTTTWTNYSNANNAWDAVANWDNGVGGISATNALLTSAVASHYKVEFLQPGVSLTNLSIKNIATGGSTTLNIRTNGFQVSGAQLFDTGSIVNVHAGGTYSNLQGGPSKTITIRGAQFNVLGGTVYFASNPSINGNGTLLVDGGSFTYNGSRNMYVGGFAGDNALMTVSNGLLLSQKAIVVGYSGTGTVRVVGGALVNNGSSITLGYGLNNAHADARMEVTGGTVTNASPLILNLTTNPTSWAELNISGGSFVQKSDTTIGASNHARVNLSGGSLLVGSNVYLGDGGQAVGELLMSDAGVLRVTNGAGSAEVFLGKASAGMGVVTKAGGDLWANRVSIRAGAFTNSGGFLAVSNSTGTGVFDVQNGTFLMAGGTGAVDRLLATNGVASVFQFSGGLLRSKSTLINNGAILSLGGGGTPVVFDLSGGTHTFQGGLGIGSNATVRGTGSIAGNVAGAAGGIVNVGNSPGVITNFGNWNNSNLVIQLEIGDVSNLVLTAGGNYDFLVITGSFTHGGSIQVDLANFTRPMVASNLLLVSWNAALGNPTDTDVSFINGSSLSWSFEDGGFYVTIPEPSTMAILLVLAAGGAFFARKTPLA